MLMQENAFTLGRHSLKYLGLSVMMSVSYFQMAQKKGDRPQTRQNVYKAKENNVH